MRWLTLLVSAIILIGPSAAAAQEKPADFPFFPSLLNTHTGKPVSDSDFSPAKRCAACHRDLYDQWSGSMHATAIVDPVFLALWKLGVKETDGAVDRLCIGCHTSIGTVAGSYRIDPASGSVTTTEIAEQGVQCDFCHTVKEMHLLKTPTLDPQNASITVEPGPVKRGPYKDSVSSSHKTAYSELHTRSEFCGACHNVFHPVTHFPIERTYEEWKESVYAQAGIQCQDCHMMPVELAVKAARTMTPQKNPGKAAGAGPVRDNLFTHEFVGANFTVPGLLGNELHAGIARERLKSAAELSVSAPAEAAPGSLAAVRVKVVNAAAGHNLPTSLTEVREMWLDVAVTDGSGKEIFRSGNLDAGGDIEPDSAVFRAWAMDKSGHHTVKPWEIARFESNKTIQPKGSAEEKFSFLVPADASGPLSVKVTLRYRSYPQSVANMLLGKEAPVLPIVDMAEAQAAIALE